MSYSTGEIAKLCGVTVRTVQYYDGEGLLKPDEFTEGGRRLYGEKSLKTLQLICAYKELGLNLKEIKEVLSNEENSRNVLIRYLEETEKRLDEEIKKSLSRRDGIRLIKRELREGKALSQNSFYDIQTIMKGKKKQIATYVMMGVVGVLADAAIIATAVIWGVTGLWIPFAVAMPCVVLLITGAVLVAYRNLAYICTDCGKKFRPKFGKFFFSKHTPKTRKLICPHCGSFNYHNETYSD